MPDIIRDFKALTRQDILAMLPGAYDDYDLLEVMKHFEEQDEDSHRSMATLELILRSPDHSETVNYIDLYLDLVRYYESEGDYIAALSWGYAMLVYGEQYELEKSRANSHRELADVYLHSGDLDTALALYTRRLHADPGDIRTYNALGWILQDCGLSILAIEALDRGLTLTGHPDIKDLQEVLEELRQGALVVTEDEDVVSHLDEIDPDVLAEFRAALALPVKTQRGEDEPEPYLPPVARLVDVGPQRDQALYNEILVWGKSLAPELIRLAFDRSLLETPAPTHAVALLRELRTTLADEFSGLTNWLDRADGNWQSELLTLHMGKVGGYSTDELEAFAAGQEYNLGIRVGAAEALGERARKLPEQRERVVDFMRSLLVRPEAYEYREESFIGYVISIVLDDIDARELYPQIKLAFDEDRVDPTVISLSEVHQQWGLDPLPEPRERQDGLYMLLKCKTCGRARFHFVQYVLVDTVTLDKKTEGQAVKYSPFIMDHEIICPKCGARDRYELTPQASFALTEPPDQTTIMEILSGEKPSVPPKPKPRVYFFRSMALGQFMHPFDALDEYQLRIAMRPGDAGLHVGLANILCLLFRYEQAMEEYRFAYELAPDDIDVVLARALSEHDFGEQDMARQMYEKVLALEVRGAVPRVEYGEVAKNGLDALKRGRRSPWEPDIYNINGDPIPILRTHEHPETPTRGKRSRKRRN